MTVAEYETNIFIYGEIISSTVTDVGYEIRVRNNTGKLATYHRLYAEFLELDYEMVAEGQEPSYYKAYFLLKK